MSLKNKLGHCDQCGVKLQFENREMERKINAYQKKYAWNQFVEVCCDDCIAKGHTITDEELGQVKTVKRTVV